MKKQKGISLIVLIITIIVIIIIATAVIVTIATNNPIKEANKARYESDRENMQAVFTNTVTKVMSQHQGNIQIQPVQLNSITTGTPKTTGWVNYTIENSVSGYKMGAIYFGKGNNTNTSYYTGVELPIYKAGETKWYVDDQGTIALQVNDAKYGEGNMTEEVHPPIENLKVGEKIFYTPKAKEYLWEAKYSGGSSDVKLDNTTQDYTLTSWKILNMNGNGTIDLIPEKPTLGTVPLGYAQGYNNGVKLLNDACNILYGNPELGVVARSINEEDIKLKMTKEALASIKDSGTNSPVLCEEQIQNPYTPENSKYPAIYEKENLSTVNGNQNKNGLKRDEQENFVEKEGNNVVDGAVTNAKSIQPHQTYWYRDHKFTEEMFENAGVDYYHLLMPNGYETKYWVATRVRHVVDEKSDFSIRSVFWGMNACLLYSSNTGNQQRVALSIFPVVTIPVHMLNWDATSGWTI